MLKGFPRRSYYGKGSAEKATRSDTRTPPRKSTRQPVYRNGKPTPQKKKIDSFEAEYQKFIADLKAKKAAAEAKQAEEVKVETPVVEEPKVEAEVIPETVATAPVDAPILNEETQPKKTRKKKEVVVETPAEPAAEPTIEGLD
jgi:hypothetical protein